MAAIRNETQEKEKMGRITVITRGRRDQLGMPCRSSMPAEAEPNMGEVVPRCLFGDLHYPCEASLHNESAVSH